MPTTTEVLVVGAGAAGLATAAELKRQGITPLVLERGRSGDSWRNRYDRLHLHTPGSLSSLPGLKMSSDYPTYPSRDQVVEYLAQYRAHHAIDVREQTTLDRLTTDGERWNALLGDEVVSAGAVVLATGAAAVPMIPTFPGADAFGGDVLHSSAYRNGDPWRGKRGLVVGAGNSGAEIAVDLVERGCSEVALSVRSPLNIVPRDPLGIPFLHFSIRNRRLPPRLQDWIAKPLVRAYVGDVRKLGFEKARRGPVETASKSGRVALIDVGTLALVRAGKIAVKPGLERYTPDGVVFTDGESLAVDVVVLATGYTHGLERFLPGADALSDEHGNVPMAISGRQTKFPGLWLCGYGLSTTGQLREIAIESRRVAEEVKARVRSAA